MKGQETERHGRNSRTGLGRRPGKGGGAPCRLRRWELALALSLSFTLLQSAAAPGALWWGVIFPGLTPSAAGPEAVEAMKRSGEAAAEALRLTGGGGSVEIRFLLLDWLARLLG